MSGQVSRRPQALTDLLEIWSYIAEDSETRADKFVDEIDGTFQLLAGQPMMGRARPELGSDIRSFPIGRYVIFYQPRDGGIDVVRVLHGARDVDGEFRG